MVNCMHIDTHYSTYMGGGGGGGGGARDPHFFEALFFQYK